MPKRESAPLKREHVWLFADDARWLEETFRHTIGKTKAIRTIIRGFRQKVEAEQAKAQDSQPTSSIQLEDLADAIE